MDNDDRRIHKKHFSTNWQTLNKGVDKVEKDLRMKRDLGIKRSDSDEMLRRLVDAEDADEDSVRHTRIMDDFDELPPARHPTHQFSDPWKQKAGLQPLRL